jgi:predicted GNAT family N-acyltransferase
MVQIELMSWEPARAEASRIRFAVFVVEQGVPADIELDEHDAACVHAVAFHAGRAIGTGRLLPDGHIGRMAVIEEWRGRGVGSAILARLIEAAAQRGDREVQLSAQVHAVEFYRAHGFHPEGGIYDDAGIPHQAMRRAL